MGQGLVVKFQLGLAVLLRGRLTQTWAVQGCIIRREVRPKSSSCVHSTAGNIGGNALHSTACVLLCSLLRMDT